MILKVSHHITSYCSSVCSSGSVCVLGNSQVRRFSSVSQCSVVVCVLMCALVMCSRLFVQLPGENIHCLLVLAYILLFLCLKLKTAIEIVLKVDFLNYRITVPVATELPRRLLRPARLPRGLLI